MEKRKNYIDHKCHLHFINIKYLNFDKIYYKHENRKMNLKYMKNY